MFEDNLRKTACQGPIILTQNMRELFIAIQ